MVGLRRGWFLAILAALWCAGVAHGWSGLVPNHGNSPTVQLGFPARQWKVHAACVPPRQRIVAVMGSPTQMLMNGGQVGQWRNKGPAEVSLDDDDVFGDDETSSGSSEVAGLEESDELEKPSSPMSKGREGEFVVGGGALRGEQEFYSMKDLQAMRVPRLKSMCEARGLKKAGTKQELIERLLASTPDLVPEVSSSQASHTPAPNVRGFALLEDGDELSVDELEEDGMMRAPPDMRQRFTPANPEHATDPDFRPRGDQLKAILNAPKIVYRGGRSFTRASSKLDKYEADGTGSGSRFSSFSEQNDVKKDFGGISNDLKVSKLPPGTRVSGDKTAVGDAQAQTLNNIPREFIPPALRSYDPSAQGKRRGPGRPRQDTEEADDGNRVSDWEVVKKGGGMENNPQESPFDAMINADIEREEALGLLKKRRGRAKKVAAVAAPLRKETPLLKDDDDEDDDDDDLIALDDVDDEMPDLDDDDEETPKKLGYGDDDDDDATMKSLIGEDDSGDDEDDDNGPSRVRAVSSSRKGRKALSGKTKAGGRGKVTARLYDDDDDDDDDEDDDDDDEEEENNVW